MDATIHAMKQFGFDDEAVIAKMRELLKEYGGQYGFIEIYSVLLEALLSNQDKENCKEEDQEAAHRETSNANVIVEGEMVEEGHPVVPTAGFIDIPLCSTVPLAAIPPPSPSPPPPPPPPPPVKQLVASLSPSTPAVDAALPLSQPPPPVMDAALQLPPPPVLDADRPLPPPPPVMDAALQLPPPPVLDVYQPLPPPPPPPPVMDAALQLPPPPVLDTDRPPPPPVMDAAIQLPPPPVLDADRPLPPPTPVTYSTSPPPGFGHQDKRQKTCYGRINEDDEEPQLIRLPSSLEEKVLPPETPSSQRGLEEVSGGIKDCPRPRSRYDFRSERSSQSVTRNQSHQPVPSSRYESQKRRDWNTFDKYLKNQSPPVTVSQCNCSHVVEFLRYLDQFGKTKVHVHGCVYFGQLFPLDAPCSCPLKQAWGSLDSMTGRLRAAYEENVDASEKNPFGNKAIRVYLKQVKECQAKARGVSYEKKKRNKVKASDEANASKLQAT